LVKITSLPLRADLAAWDAHLREARDIMEAHSSHQLVETDSKFSRK